MKIAVVGMVENGNIFAELDKQTLQPDMRIIVIDDEPAKGIENRRKRIAENQSRLQALVKDIDVDLVWQVEGDCELPENALEELYASYLEKRGKDFAYVSGIQVGRHGVYCIGAWHIAPDELRSVQHDLRGLQEVDATGLYCLLAPKNKWLEGVASWDGELYGPDVVWGLSIKGKKYVDMDLQIGHKVKGGVIRPSDISTCDVIYKKIDGKWHFKQLS